MVGKDREHLEREQDALTGYTVTKIKIKYLDVNTITMHNYLIINALLGC